MANLSEPAPPSFVARGATPSMIRKAVDARGLATFGAATAAALLLCGVMLFALWARTRVTEGGYELGRLAKEHHQLLRDRESLTYQVSRLRGAGRLTQAAQKMGMGPATAERTIVLTGAGGADVAQELPLVPLVAGRP